MRKQKQDEITLLEKRLRMNNLFYALKLDLISGKTREERLANAFKYQAQSNLAKVRWLC